MNEIENGFEYVTFKTIMTPYKKIDEKSLPEFNICTWNILAPSLSASFETYELFLERYKRIQAFLNKLSDNFGVINFTEVDQYTGIDCCRQTNAVLDKEFF